MMPRLRVWMRCLLAIVLASFISSALAKQKTATHFFVKPGHCLNKVVNQVNHAIVSDSTELRLSFSGVDDVCFDSLVLALRHNKSLMRLYLSHNALTDESASLFALLLNVNRTIQGIDLSNNRFTHDGIQSIANTMIDNDQLHFLYLKDMQLTDASIRSVARLLKHGKALQHLDLSMNHLSEDSLIRLASALPVNSKLQTLGLFQTDLRGKGKALGALLAKLPHLHWLNIGGNRLSENDLKLVMHSLDSHQHIRGLDLSFSDLDDEGVRAMGPWLSQAPELVRLVVHHNLITDKGAKVLTDKLKSSKTLHTVAINNNLLTEKSVPGFKQLFNEVPTLVNFFVFDNHIGSHAFSHLAATSLELDRLTVIARNDQQNTAIF